MNIATCVVFRQPDLYWIAHQIITRDSDGWFSGVDPLKGTVARRPLEDWIIQFAAAAPRITVIPHGNLASFLSQRERVVKAPANIAVGQLINVATSEPFIPAVFLQECLEEELICDGDRMEIPEMLRIKPDAIGRVLSSDTSVFGVVTAVSRRRNKMAIVYLRTSDWM
jgi:hypothetical protein